MRISAVALAALVACFLIGAPRHAQAAGGDLSRRAVGTAGSAFLTVEVDPRGIAMGSAYTSVVKDAFSMYWNPAGLAQIPRISLVAMHNEYIAGIRFQYAAIAKRFSDTSVMGMAVRYMDAGNIVNRDINAQRIGTFRPRSYVYEFGWGKQINDLTDAERDVSLGIVGRFIHSDFIAHANGFSGDIGVQIHYTESYSPYNFGIVIQNIGKGQKFDQVRDNLPVNLRVGASVWPQPYILLSLDGVVPIDNQPYVALGTELKMEGPNDTSVFLRGGFNMRNQFNNLEGLRGFSAGTGIKAVNFRLDYAFVPFGILGNAHRFSVSWELPPKRSRRFRRR